MSNKNTVNQQTDDNTKPKSSKKLSTLLALKQFLAPYKTHIVLFCMALLFTSGITLSVGQGVKMVIDKGFADHSLTHLKYAISFISLLAVLMALGTYIRFYLISWLGERVSADIRSAVFAHIIRLHPAFFETNRSGDIMSRLTTDTTLLQSIIGSSMSMALRSTISFLGALTLLLITNIKLALFILLGVPIILMPILIYGRKVRKLSRKSQDSVADVGTYAGEIIQHIKTVQSFTHEEYETTAFNKEVEQAFAVAKMRVKQRALLMGLVILLVFCALAGMLWVGGSDVIEGRMSGGDLGAFLFYAILMATSVATISEVYGELQRAAGATERLLELLYAPNAISSNAINVLNADTLTPSLSFQDVSFSYPSRPDKKALNRLSLEIPNGKVIALVGPSGAGKTTVFDLIQRFYDPQEGNISLGNINICDIPVQDLRNQIGVVQQQPALFTQDVFYNIRYGKPDASDEEVIAAAKAAYAHDFIMHLPEGYHSDLGEQGVRLSGGQKQRIAIARALLKNPRILLLDEATSALDAESEHHVHRALDTLMQGRTTIIIAHRLATVIHADKIIVMEDGQVIATGTHEELLANNDLYRRLAELQFTQDNKK